MPQKQGKLNRRRICFPFELQAWTLSEESHTPFTSFKTELTEASRVKDVPAGCPNSKTNQTGWDFKGVVHHPFFSLLLFPCPDRLPVSLMSSFKLKHTFPVWLQLLRTAARWNRLCSKHVQNMHCRPLQRCCLKISRFCYTDEAKHGLPMSVTYLYEL